MIESDTVLGKYDTMSVYDVSEMILVVDSEDGEELDGER